MTNAEFLEERLNQKELCSITLLKEYMQFNFDGPVFNFYEFPKLGINGKWISPTQLGYFDEIKHLLGLKVISVEEVPDVRLNLNFDSNFSVQLSLRQEDRSSVEAAMFQAGGGGGWIVW